MALPVNIDDLLNARTVESVRIEFKKGWNPEEVIHSICAFANDINDFGSGFIIIGVEEKDGLPILPPEGLHDSQIDAIQKRVVELCFKIRPTYFPVIEPVLVDGKHIIILWITTGDERPYQAPSTLGPQGQNKIYVRPCSVTIVATPDLEAKLRELAAYKHFDDRVNSRASLGDFDLGLIQSYLQEIKSQLYNDAPKLSMEDLSLKMQIARGPKENIKPINVGLLLFSKNPEKFFEGCKTNLVEFEDEAGIKYSEKAFLGPVHVQIRQILDYLNLNTIKQYNKKGSNRPEVERFYNYPYPAIEEAVVNALYHRSYENSTPNEIRIYKSGKNRRIEILSYPGPMPPIDNNALQQLQVVARNYRNIRLGDWLKNLRLAEKYATGIPTMVEALNKNGSPLPSLLTDDAKTYFLVTFKIHPDTPFDESPEIEVVDHIILSNLQQTILEALKTDPLEENSLKALFKENISQELKFLETRELLKYKSISKLFFFKTNLFYLTERGKELLKKSF